MGRILWIRHGESISNRIPRRFACRSYDPPLTDLGQRQAERLASHFRSAVPTPAPVIYCSPLLRARQTARTVADVLGATIRSDERLREIDVGELDGRSDDASRQVCERMKVRWAAGALEAAYPGGESLGGLIVRLRSALIEVVSEYPERAVLVVAHKGILAASANHLFSRVSGESAVRCAWDSSMPVPNCSITTIDVTADDGRFDAQVREWGSTAHLSPRTGSDVC